MCLGSIPNGVGNIISVAQRISSDDLTELKQYIAHYEEAIKNNYDCVKYNIDNMSHCLGGLNSGPPEDCNIQDPTIPSRKDLDLENPLQYSKCWFNLPPIVGDNFGCGWKE